MNDKYSSICYEKPNLKEVIARIDFPSLPQDFFVTLPKAVENSIIANFPIPEPRTAQIHEVMFSDTAQHFSKTESKEWVFYSKERDKTITIGPAHMVLSIKKYQSFERLIADIKLPLDTIFSNAADLTANRIGIRYVNIIESKSNKDPLNWKGYFNKSLLSLADFDSDKSKTSRVFNILEYNFDGLMLKAQFGIPNPDFPAPIKKKQFVIDLDAYTFGAFSREDISENLEAAHAVAQDFFERAITEKIRKTMKKLEVTNDQQ